jgi:hypothetical protein
MKRGGAGTELCDGVRFGLYALLAIFVIWSVWEAPALLSGLASLLLGLVLAMMYAMFASAWVVYNGGVIADLALSPLLVGALIVTVVCVPGFLARRLVAVKRSAQFLNGGFILLACGAVLVIAAALLLEALFMVGLGALTVIVNRAAIGLAPR